MPARRFLLLGLALILMLVQSGIAPAWAIGEEPIESYPDWKVGLSYEWVSVETELTPYSAGGTELRNRALRYRPAESGYRGIILGYRWLAGTLAFAVPADSTIRDLEGESRYRDVRLTLYFPRWGIEATHNRFEGYLIDNDESDPLSSGTLAGQPYLRLPAMSSFGVGLNGFYVLKPETYSLAAAFNQSEPILRSGGSFIALATFRNQSFRNSTGLIPGVSEILDRGRHFRLHEPFAEDRDVRGIVTDLGRTSLLAGKSPISA